MSRLIDADVFIEQVASSCMTGATDQTRAKALIRVIKKQPTAYDVDKIVEQLGELNDNEVTLANITAIVRKGGVE